MKESAVTYIVIGATGGAIGGPAYGSAFFNLHMSVVEAASLGLKSAIATAAITAVLTLAD